MFAIIHTCDDAQAAIVLRDGANLNLIIGNEAIEPVSGSVPHRTYPC